MPTSEQMVRESEQRLADTIQQASADPDFIDYIEKAEAEKKLKDKDFRKLMKAEFAQAVKNCQDKRNEEKCSVGPKEQKRYEWALDEAQYYLKDELKQNVNEHNFIMAMKKADEKRKPNNPFNKVRGIYQKEINLNQAGVERIASIQDKIKTWLEKEHDKPFFMDPSDTKGTQTFRDDGTKTRMKLGRLLKNAPPEIKNLMTKFPTVKGDKATIVISDWPTDLLRKSSSRKWASESCESLGGMYGQGPFSDIKNNNAIAYIYIGDKNPVVDEPNGRYMLRWCDNEEGKPDVAVEPVMYPRGLKYRMEIYNALNSILKDKGYGNYNKCITPYSYDGYSDYKGGGGIISYKAPGEIGLQKYATDPNISRNMALWLLDAEKSVKRALAENDVICGYPRVRERMMNDVDPSTTYNMLETCAPKINCDDAYKLLKSGNEDILRWLAMYPYGGKWAELSKECACDIYTKIANLKPTKKDWETSESDTHITSPERIKWKLAANKNLPEECACDILETLIDDKDASTAMQQQFYVNSAIAERTEIPQECACSLGKKLSKYEYGAWGTFAGNLGRFHFKDQDCAYEIIKNLIEPIQGAGDTKRQARERVKQEIAKLHLEAYIGEERACKIFKILANDTDQVSSVVARNEWLPKDCACDIYKNLAKSNNKRTLEHLANNVFINPSGDRTISQDCACDIFNTLEKTKWVSDSIAGNTNLGEALGQDCACDVLKKVRSQEYDDTMYIRDGGIAPGGRQIRMAMASNPNLPENCACDILTDFVKKGKYEMPSPDKKKTKVTKKMMEHRLEFEHDKEIRYKLAGNRGIPKDCRCDIFNELSDREYAGMVFNAMANNDTISDCGKKVILGLLKPEYKNIQVLELVKTAFDPNNPNYRKYRCDIAKRVMDLGDEHDKIFEKYTEEYQKWNERDKIDQIGKEYVSAPEFESPLYNPARGYDPRVDLAKATIPSECACDIYTRLLMLDANPKYELSRYEDSHSYMKLNNEHHDSIKKNLAKNANITKTAGDDCACNIFDKLSGHIDYGLSMIPPVDDYTYTNDRFIRQAVAENLWKPRKCLKKIEGNLAHDPDLVVRTGLANTTQDCDVLDVLKDDAYTEVREKIARRELPYECACDIAKYMAYDYAGEKDNEYIIKGLARTKLPDKCACEVYERIYEDGGAYESLAANENIPDDCGDLAETLVDMNEPDIDFNLAENQNIPMKSRCVVLKKLAKSPNYEIKVKVANNPSIPPECAGEIYNDLSKDTRLEAYTIFNKALNPELRPLPKLKPIKRYKIYYIDGDEEKSRVVTAENEREVLIRYADLDIEQVETYDPEVCPVQLMPGWPRKYASSIAEEVMA